MYDNSPLRFLSTLLYRDNRSEQLAALVARCSDAKMLRRFACACAQEALTVTGISTPQLREALVVARSLDDQTSLPSGVELIRQAVERSAQELDNLAFDAYDAVEAGAASREVYHEAFSRARAAESVLRCLEPSALHAAVEGCYAAYYATDNVDTLIAVARTTLR